MTEPWRTREEYIADRRRDGIKTWATVVSILIAAASLSIASYAVLRNTPKEIDCERIAGLAFEGDGIPSIENPSESERVLAIALQRITHAKPSPKGYFKLYAACEKALR